VNGRVTGGPPRRLLLRLVLVLAAFLALGAVAGVVWERLWSPPTGLVVDNAWYLDADGVQEDFSGTGLYVLVALATGALVGLATALTTRGHELATLAVVAAGSVAAAWLMLLTGTALGPPDPRPLADGREDYTEIPSDLRVVGVAPYVALPAGALTTVAVCFIGLNGSRRRGMDGEPDG